VEKIMTKAVWNENPQPLSKEDEAAIFASRRWAIGAGRVWQPAPVGVGDSMPGSPGAQAAANSAMGTGMVGVGSCSPLPSIEEFLSLGAPTLALARARGV
jgi:hypothetical protein